MLVTREKNAWMMHFKKENVYAKEKEKKRVKQRVTLLLFMRQHWSREKREKLSILTMRIQTPKDKL